MYGALWLQVQAEWIMRPSEDEALRSAHIGASSVSEVCLSTPGTS